MYKNSGPHIILGIDPGIEKLGIAILKIDKTSQTREEVLYSECFMTSSKDTVQDRLASIYSKIIEIVKEYKPTIVAIEKIFFTVNQKTAVVVAQARGTVLAAIGQNMLPIIELTPTEIKESITGYGRATKKDIIKMIPKIIKLKTNSLQDDELDAIAIALTAAPRIFSTRIS
jgi:crossover junction endodeoxyribonuclease RuvC